MSVRSTELRETHSGIVLLCGERAYKLKKPVDLGFLDFTTLEARRHACRRELELNRRLAPDVYLDVAELQGGSDGHPIEYVLVMRRMPDDLRLSTLLAEGHNVDEQLRALARLLARFHSRAERSPQIAAQIAGDQLRRRWMENFTNAAQYVPSVLPRETYERIRSLALTFVDGRGLLFDERAEAGYGVDGHGDLLADDIFCLPDGPRVLDCLDFDDHLRWIDVIDDVAFLAMDLERQGHPAEAATFLHWYTEFSANDAPDSLIHHYVAYRAFVRALVSAIRASQNSGAIGSGDTFPTEHADAARGAADLALRHLRLAQVRLVLVGGSPGTGKSTVASALADRLGYVLLSSDAIRKEQGRGGPAVTYDRRAKADVYRLLLERASQVLRRGESVVADATWSEDESRAAAARVAAETSSELIALECQLPADVAAARAQRRYDAGGAVSDADAAIATRLAARRQPWPEASVIDTSRSPAEASEQAIATVAALTYDLT